MSSSVNCETCKELYNSDNKKPIYLPCSHTFCRSCLEANFKKNSYLKCPLDNKKHFQPLDQYPINRILLKEIKAEAPGTSKIKKESKDHLI